MTELALATQRNAVATATTRGTWLQDVSASAAQPTSPRADVDAEALSSLIGEIYDCALDPARWPQVLNSCRLFVGGEIAAIFSKDLTGADFRVFQHDGRLDMHYAQLYHERYAVLDPGNAGHLFAEIEEPISTSDILDYDEFRTSRFYTEWATPQRIVDFVGAAIEKSGVRAVMFGVFRHERHGLVDESTRARVRLIVPHIRRAVLIGRVIDDARAEASGLSDTFDGLAAAMFLVDATGRVVHANAAAVAMLQAGNTMQARKGRIASVDREATAALSSVIAAAASGDAAVGLRGISIAIEGLDGDHYAAHVLPLTSGARQTTGSRYSAVAALFVHRAALDTPAPPEVIARTFGLTPTELRVLVAIVQVGGVAETAEALGVSEATVKTHLHNIFGKTGAVRQADLVKLVASFASPLAR